MSRSGNPSIPVSERAQHFLKVLVERYIREGSPVGSRTLAKDAGYDLSPATIRNVMSDLEDLGFVASPHTSAGRIPTVSGYRMFVDSLLTLQPPDKMAVSQLREQLDLDHDTDPKHMVESASRMLSELTRMAGVVMIPRREHQAYRQIEFVSLSGCRVLTILVTGEGEVHNKIIETEKPYSAAQLEQAANYLNQLYRGEDLERVRARLLDEMKRTRDDMDQIMTRAVSMAEQVFGEAGGKDDIVVSGQTNLMSFDELAQMERLKQLFDAFTEKHQILHLLDRCVQADGVQIFIGEESGYDILENCSVVTASYRVEGETAGVLGVIGPTRMAYDRVIPLVDITARLMSAALKPR